jgi:hypothetical protein
MIKQITLLILILIIITPSYSIAVGSQIQLGTGGLTPHFSGSKRNYCNQWNNTGIIVNKSYYIAFYKEQFGVTYMVGNDSICSEIEGIFFHYIFSQDEWNDFGITVGGYAYNQGNWDKHAEKTPSGIDAPEPTSIEYFGRPIVPVLALSWGLHLIRRDSWSLKLNSLLTPLIFNHSIAYEYRF